MGGRRVAFWRVNVVVKSGEQQSEGAEAMSSVIDGIPVKLITNCCRHYSLLRCSDFYLRTSTCLEYLKKSF